jgi:hypothetical protein
MTTELFAKTKVLRYADGRLIDPKVSLTCGVIEKHQTNNLLGYNIFVSEYIPQNKIFFGNKNDMYVCEINYPQLIYSIVPDFMEAVHTIARYNINKLFRKADYLFGKKL